MILIPCGVRERNAAIQYSRLSQGYPRWPSFPYTHLARPFGLGMNLISDRSPSKKGVNWAWTTEARQVGASECSLKISSSLKFRASYTAQKCMVRGQVFL